MAVAAAREIKNGEVAFIGTGLPMVAAYLAKATHAPDVNLVFESGIVDPRPHDLATGVGDYRLAYNATKISGMWYALSLLQQGKIDIGFLGTAEIDRHGNLNSTAIGPYEKPKVRLPGSGGANDIASMAKRFVVVARLEPRRFVKRLHYLTSPGFLGGPGDRENAGLPGAGPIRVITNYAILGFHVDSREMEVEQLFPGVTVDDIEQNCGFEIVVRNSPPEFPPPNDIQIQLMRTVIDPDGIYIGGTN